MLTISHYIYLTKEERYKLFDQVPVKTVGVNVPVWFNRGDTSEPAKEVFCRYNIFNNITASSIKPLKDGYDIYLPKDFINFKTDSSGAFRLLDVEDGGCEELVFKQQSKVVRENKTYSVVHFIEIKPIETLFQTLTIL